MRRAPLALTALGMLVLNTSSDGAVHYSVNGGTAQAFTGSIGVSTDTTRVNVWADSASENIGAIEITGYTNVSFALILGTASGLPTNPTTSLTPACTHFAGVTAINATTLASMRFVGAMSGDLTGDLNVGQVYRLQVGDDLLADVKAHSTDNQHSDDGLAIRQIVVLGEMLADVIAAATGNCGIEKVSAVDGITDGSIVALYGVIREIESAGPISIESPGSISGGNGVWKITAIDGEEVPQDITADIIANAGSGGSIREIFCGNLAGSVTADSIEATSGLLGTTGIVVVGDLDAKVDIVVDADRGISATGRIDSVRVRRDLHASIVAEGALNNVQVDG